MVAMSVSPTGQGQKGSSSKKGGSAQGSLSSAGQAQQTMSLSGQRFFTSFLKEFERQIQQQSQPKDGRDIRTSLQKAKVPSFTKAVDVSPSSFSKKEEPSSSAKNAKKSTKTVASSDNDSQDDKVVQNDASQSQQNWLLQQMMALSPLPADQQGKLQESTQASDQQQNDVSASGADDGGQQHPIDEMAALLSASQEGKELHASHEHALSSPLPSPSLDEDTQMVEAIAPQELSQKKNSLGDGRTSSQAMDSSTASALEGENRSPFQHMEGVQISDISVTSQGKSFAPSVQKDAEDMRVESASYLNSRDNVFYTGLTEKAASSSGQSVAQQGNGQDLSKDAALKNADTSINDVSSIAASSVENKAALAAQTLHDDSSSMGQEEQDSVLSSGEEEQSSGKSSSDSTVPTSFQGLVNGNVTGGSPRLEERLSGEKSIGASHQGNELEGEEVGRPASLLAQKRLVDPSSKVEMTLKTSDLSSVRVQVTRLPDGVAEVALQGGDDATTKALSKSRHELLEQLNAAGIHATSVKIDVLPADLSGMNSEHTHDQMGQNASYGGQSGHGGNTPQREQDQRMYDSASFGSSTESNGIPHKDAGNIVVNLKTPHAVTGSGLNISV